MPTINLNDNNRLVDPILDHEGQAITSQLFGGIIQDTQTSNIDGYVDSLGRLEDYETFNNEAFEYLELGHIRYPDGELPDAFLNDKGNGSFGLKHNMFNGTPRYENGDIKPVKIPNPYNDETGDPEFVTFATLADVEAFVLAEYASRPTPSVPSDPIQTLFDDLTPAFDLNNPDLLDPGLLPSDDNPGRQGFTASLAQAVASGSSFALVLPEFQYLKVPVDSVTGETFIPDDHVKFDEIVTDVTAFLTKLYNEDYGPVPADFTLEIGNENYFGWNKGMFTADTADGDKDYDSYSAYSMAVLTAVKEYREANSDHDFHVAIQSAGPAWIASLNADFADAEIDGVSGDYTDLFAQVDTINIPTGLGLDSVLDDVANVEDHWDLTALPDLLEIISNASGPDFDPSDVRVNLPAWSSELIDNGSPAGSAAGAATVLSLFSGLAELGIDTASNWGIGAWDGYGTQLTSIRDDGSIEYSAAAVALQMMAQSLPGTYQLATNEMDAERDDTLGVYAYENEDTVVIFAADLGNDAGIQSFDLLGNEVGGITSIKAYAIVPDPNGGFTQGPEQIITLAPDGSFDYDFNDAYETVQFIIERTPGGATTNTLTGTSGNDNLEGGSTDDFINGNGGRDGLWGRDGDDIIFGGDGIDNIGAGGDDDYINAGGGNDTVGGGSGNDTIHLGDGNDTAGGGPGNDIIYAGAGNDIANGGGGHDHIYLGDGDDESGAGGHNDHVWGGAGNDDLGGGAGSDHLFGGSGDDTLGGGSEDDFLFGGLGNDHLSGGAGNDTYTGGAGADKFSVGFANTNNEDLEFPAETETITDFELGVDVIQLIWGGTASAGVKTGLIIQTQVGDDLVLTHATWDFEITLQDFTGTLTESDFSFL